MFDLFKFVTCYLDFYYPPLMKTVILPTHKRTKSNSFWDALFRTPTVAPFVGMFSKLATKPTKPIIVLSP
jgi:hypothetical protein